ALRVTVRVMVAYRTACALHSILTLLAVLLKRERQPNATVRTPIFGESGNVVTDSAVYMRPNPSLLAPALKTLPHQNQLGFQRMARLRAPVAASMLASVARAMGASASAVVAGLVLLAVGSIGATAYKAGGLIEPVGLGLLALLAAAGVFLVF